MANDRQKKALTALSLLMVVAGSAFAVWLAAVVMMGEVRGDSQPGRFFMLLIADWDSLDGAFRALPPLVSLGLAYFGAYKIKDWLFYAIVAFSTLGFFATAYLLFEVPSVTTAKLFWAYSPTDNLQDYHSFATAAKVGLGALVAWFIGVVGTEVGARVGD